MRRVMWEFFVGCLVIVVSLFAYTNRFDGPPATKTFLDRNGRVIGTLHPLNDGFQVWTPLAAVPSAIIEATIHREDRWFYWHPGINPIAIAKAAVSNLRRGKVWRGGSTITQQLAKNLIQEREGHLLRRSWWNKSRELALALGMELMHSKAWILERYLNAAYYGHRCYGIGAAADYYFGKRLAELSEEEISVLVMLPQRPGLPLASLATGDRRPATISGRHFIEYVARQQPGGGSVVYTTLDLDLQRRLEGSVAALLQPRLADDPQLTAAAVVIDVVSGDLLGMVGSRDYFDATSDGQVNGAVALRQPGSTLKPFTYFAAFAKGYTPDTILTDAPMSFPAVADPTAEVYAPQNFDRRFHGAMTMREALANSYNVPAVAVLNAVGLSTYHDTLRRFGFTSLTKPPPFYGLSVTLGSGEVTLLQLTNAYAVLARGGKFLPYAVTKHEARLPAEALAKEGSTNHESPVEIIPNAHRYASQITQILSDPAARLQAFGFNDDLQIDGHTVAVKTGTSYDHRDNWVVGYTPEVAIGVWVGHADGSPLPGTPTGATGAGPVWHACMEQVVREKSVTRKTPVIRRTWDVGREPNAFSSHVSRVTSHESRVTPYIITSPIPNTTYRLVPFLPRRHQQILAEARAVGDDPPDLRWSLDGRPLETTRERRARVWLPPEPGHHVLQVEAADGSRQTIAFRVQEELP